MHKHLKLCLLDELTLCSYEMNFLIPDQILCLEIYFDNNIATPAFFDYCYMLYLFLREGNVTPLQYSCLENPMDGGAW